MGGRESPKVPWIRGALYAFLGVGLLLSFADGITVTTQDGEQMVSPGPNFHGNPLIQRNTYVTGLDRMWIMHDIALPMGYLKKFFFYVWEYNAGLTNDVIVQIWRPVSLPYDSAVDSSLMLVWEYRVTVDLNTAGTLYTISLGAGEQFLVKEGDVIGWTTTNFLLPFACSYSSTDDVYLTSYQGTLPAILSTYTFGRFGGYKYKCSAGVEVEQLTATTGGLPRGTTRPTVKTTTFLPYPQTTRRMGTPLTSKATTKTSTTMSTTTTKPTTTSTKPTTTTTKPTTTTTKATTTTTKPTTTTTKPTTTTTKPTTTTTRPTTTTTKPTTTTIKPTTTTTTPTTTTTKPTTTTTKPTTTTTKPTTTTTKPTTTTTKPTTTTTKPTTTTTKPTTTTTKPTTTTTKATTTTTRATTTTTKPTTTTTKPTTTTTKPTTTEATKPTSTTKKPTDTSKEEPDKASTTSTTKPGSTSASTKAARSDTTTPGSSATAGSGLPEPIPTAPRSSTSNPVDTSHFTSILPSSPFEISVTDIITKLSSPRTKLSTSPIPSTSTITTSKSTITSTTTPTTIAKTTAKSTTSDPTTISTTTAKPTTADPTTKSTTPTTTKLTTAEPTTTTKSTTAKPTTTITPTIPTTETTVKPTTTTTKPQPPLTKPSTTVTSTIKPSHSDYHSTSPLPPSPSTHTTQNTTSPSQSPSPSPPLLNTAGVVASMTTTGQRVVDDQTTTTAAEASVGGQLTGSELTIIIVSCVVVGGVVIVIIVIACACCCRSKPAPKPMAGQTYMDFQKGKSVYAPHELPPPPMLPPGAMGAQYGMAPPGAMGQQYGMAPPVPMPQQYGMAPNGLHQDPYIVPTGHMSVPPGMPILPPGGYHPHDASGTLPRHLAPPPPPMVPTMRPGGAPNRRGPPAGAEGENESIYNSLHDSDFDNSDGEKEKDEDIASYMSIDSDGLKPKNDYYNSVENVNKDNDDYENVQEGSGGSLPPGAKQMRDIRDVEYGGVQPPTPMYKPSPNAPMSTSVRRMKALLDQMEDDFKPRKTNKYTKAPSRDASYKTMGKLSTTEDNYVNSMAAKLANRAGTLQHKSTQPDNHEHIPLSYRSLSKS